MVSSLFHDMLGIPEKEEFSVNHITFDEWYKIAIITKPTTNKQANTQKL